jgi:hypothetical protein
MTITTLKFCDGSASLESIRAVTEETWTELGEPGQLREQARDAGFDLETLGVARPNPYDVRSASAGFEPVGTAILVGLGAWASSLAADVAKDMILDLWRQIILPRIKDRLGSDAIGSQEEL